MKPRVPAITSGSIRLAVLLVAVVGAVFGATQQIPTGRAAIEGVVIDSSTGKPIPGASIYPLRPRINAGGTQSDNDGRFRLENIETGKLAIHVSGSGEPADWWFTLTSGQEVRNVVFRGTTGGIVSGRVVDAAGAPVADAQIRLLELRDTTIAGKTWVNAGQLSISNANGEFRTVPTYPGRYLLQVGPFVVREGGVASENVLTNPQKPVVRDIGVVLYPGVHDPAKASTVEVKSGEETRVGSIRLTPSDQGRIRFRIAGGSIPTAAIRIVRSGGTLSEGWLYESADPTEREFRPDLLGRYEFQWVERGLLSGTQVHFDGKDVVISIPPSSAITSAQFNGRVLLESAGGGPPQPLLNNRIVITHQSFFFPETCRETTSMPLGENGSFLWSESIPETREGSPKVSKLCRLSVGVDNPDVYLESVRQGTRDVLTEGAIGPVRESAVVVFSANGGILQGVVKTRGGSPAHNAVIALVPQPPLSSRTDRSNTHRMGHSDQNGGFEIRGLIPGVYRVYVWAQSEPLWRSVSRGDFNAELAKPFEDRGRSVTIEKGKQTSADLQVP